MAHLHVINKYDLTIYLFDPEFIQFIIRPYNTVE